MPVLLPRVEHATSLGAWSLALALVLQLSASCWAQVPVTPAQQRIEAVLQAQLSANPGDAATWRMWGRLREQQGDLPGAQWAFEQSARLAPEDAAAQFDFGRILLERQEFAQASTHLREAVELAPESSYARDARLLLAAAPASALDPVGLSVAAGDVGAGDRLSTDLEEPRRQYIFLQLESGVLYNSNVELTPISRELSASEQASAQAILDTQAELLLLDAHSWRAGVLFNGYFTFNESNSDQFNVQDYQGGAYLQRSTYAGACEIIPRLAYTYAYDTFAGHEFGFRHSVTASLSIFAPQGHHWQVYATSDYGNFVDDGAVPSQDSLDGWTYTAGLLREYRCDLALLTALRVGAEGAWADLDGSTFAYGGGLVYAEAEVPLLFAGLGTFRFGWGYRDYFEYEFTPSRNEFIWNAGLELRQPLYGAWYLLGTLDYDLFDSKNEEFRAQRYTAGVSVGVEY